jgi:hypothetical protein
VRSKRLQAKKKGASKNDREEALNDIRKKIRLEVSNEFQRRFFEKHVDTGLVREINANERSQEETSMKELKILLCFVKCKDALR